MVLNNLKYRSRHNVIIEGSKSEVLGIGTNRYYAMD